MKISHSVFICLCLLIEIAGMYIFFKGFFPVKTAIPGRATLADLPDEPIDLDQQNQTENGSLKPAFGKLVIMLIDAMRADFVFGGKAGQHMPFTSGLISEGKTMSFLAKANPPTVTMPRIKAITTGGIPGFIDVVLNLESSALVEDNIISQLYHANRTVVFYGDDTWLKLFPEFFTRSEGTTSFFVTDYTEVDNNVTRHIGKEMASTDWDVMILHYLGLDHIGHLSGPTSPLVEPKLNEMDQIVQTILTELIKQDNTATLPSLLVLCGDHGMSDVGSHGGASANEITTPLVFLSSTYMKDDGQPYSEAEVKQIDLSPTLSLLLGLPIPQNSLGRTIAQMLEILPIRDQLRALQVNGHQLTQVLMENVNSYETEPGYLQYQRALKLHSSWLASHTHSTSGINHELLGQKVIEQYISAIDEISSRIASSLAKYDEHAMVVGVLLFWEVLCALLFGVSHLNICRINEVSLPIGGHSTIFILIGCCLAILSVQVTICTVVSGGASEVLCDNSGPAVFLSATFVLSSAVCLTVMSQCVLPMSKVKLFLKTVHFTTGQKILVGLTVVHTFSLLSSSFVEEEHQTWYFFTMTVTLWFLYRACVMTFEGGRVHRETDAGVIEPDNKTASVFFQSQDRGESFEEEYKEKPDVKGRGGTEYGDAVANDKYNTCDNKIVDSDLRDELQQKEKKETSDATEEIISRNGCNVICSKTLILAVVVALCGRLLRAWNQTGMKWADRPDIGDWFVRPENKLPLSVLVVVSYFIICVTRHCRGRCHPLLVFSLIGVYCYRAATSIIIAPLLSSTEPGKGLYQAWLVYSLVFLYILKTVYAFSRRGHGAKSEATQSKQGDFQQKQVLVKCAEDVYNIGIILTALLLRPHNAAVLALLVVQEHHVATEIWPKLLPSSPVWMISLLHLWFGSAAFYAQGNSNSAATIDISAGYIGLDSHHMVIAGTLTLLSTYSGPLLWIISLLIYVIKNHSARYKRSIQEMIYTFALTRALPLAVYTVLVSFQRYHLFVWSVFSPKVMYEGMLVFVYSTVISILMVHSYIIQKLGLLKISTE
ncbi:GPI ethanolamine phosphate transferase 2-like [Ptychodera flava]|uniref:GPI ethanolamine phosphate transferase 2-like n=1 Tax=Ptychodera flava TaxID=63121 RepID=UPI003969F23F